jgi:glutamate/aspartate transport system substrate-binding protein
MTRLRSCSLIVGTRLAIGLSAVLVCAAIQAAEVRKAPAAADHASDAVKIGVQTNAFPFSFNAGTKSNPVYRGYAVDLCLEVMSGWRKRQGRVLDPARDIKWVEVISRNRLMLLLAGEIDMECSSTSNTPGRRALGLAFSPTYFVSSVGLLVRPELSAHTGSLMSLVNQAREKEWVFVAPTGTTPQQHLQELAAEVDSVGSKRLRLKQSSDRPAAYAMLIDAKTPAAHALVMDEILLVAALRTDPRLSKAGLKLAPWSPAPGELECYGIMTRASNAKQLHAGGHDLTQVVRSVMLDLRQPGAQGGISQMQRIYQRWFERPLSALDLPKSTPVGITLGIAPSPALSRALVSKVNSRECD